MEHLFLAITEIYSKSNFRIIECFENDCRKKKNKKQHYYELYIEDVCSEEFKSFEELEDYIFNLYKIACVKQAENILKEKNE